MASPRSASLTYPYADWGRILEALRATDTDLGDDDTIAYPLALARLIEREAALWDDVEFPQTVAMTPEQKEQIARVANVLGIEEMKPPQPS